MGVGEGDGDGDGDEDFLGVGEIRPRGVDGGVGRPGEGGGGDRFRLRGWRRRGHGTSGFGRFNGQGSMIKVQDQ